MNDSTEKQTEAIRSDIDVTRRRMDDTMDALGDRLQPRHLLDEVLGMLRGSGSDGENKLTQMRQKFTQSADTAMHSVVDAVKSNPMPALLIGAGVAWMIYESRRNKMGDSADGNYYGYSREGDPLQYDTDTHYDRPLEYPSGYATGEGSEGSSTLSDVKDKLSSAAEGVKGKLSQVGGAAREKAGALRERAGETLQAAKQRAGEMGTKVKDGTRQAYTATRERVVTTADQHPLEVGLVALAAGLIAGLAVPTPNVINRRIGSRADDLRDRTKQAGSEMLEKGKRVAQAAVSAVKDEAEAQGLTAERLRSQASAIGEKAKDAVQNQSRQEGFSIGNQTGMSSQTGNQSGAQSCDPSSARPAV